MASGGEKDSKSNPKYEQAVINMLKEMGVSDYEPAVVNHLMNFAYRYTSDILTDARVYSAHAKKKTIDADDIALAIKIKDETTFVSPPSKEVIAEAAAARNSMPLPCVKSSVGPRLPADRYALTSTNYRLKPSAKRKIVQPRVNIAGVSHIGQRKTVPASFIRTNPAFAQRLGTVAALPMSRPILTIAKPAAKPNIQVTQSTSSISTPAYPTSAAGATGTVINVSPMSVSQLLPAKMAGATISGNTSSSTEVPKSTKPTVCDN
ncbi:transcription initiation factor TFIID subunit 9-like [Uloborus diversus]|uniref:transcription initiation factor TFIID subunit 9-like n=1 Tax=Uloborus diversus TaxID=327109 RepID=UPI00240A915F|nr:transcription initiation factor TFIID subunit 9-like [Uloborus diversus]